MLLLRHRSCLHRPEPPVLAGATRRRRRGFEVPRPLRSALGGDALRARISRRRAVPVAHRYPRDYSDCASPTTASRTSVATPDGPGGSPNSLFPASAPTAPSGAVLSTSSRVDEAIRLLLMSCRVMGPSAPPIAAYGPHPPPRAVRGLPAPLPGPGQRNRQTLVTLRSRDSPSSSIHVPGTAIGHSHRNRTTGSVVPGRPA